VTSILSESIEGMGKEGKAGAPKTGDPAGVETDYKAKKSVFK
jgi:hypothetical protein